MDENEILSRLDARGRAAADGTRRATAQLAVPPFDPDVVLAPVPADRGAGRRWLAVGGVAAALVLLAGVVGLLATRDDEGDPAVDTGPVRQFVADHVPEGLVPGFVTSVPSVGGVSAELYGPAPTEPRAAVGVEPDEVADGVDFEAEGQEGWEETTFGDRDGFVMTDPDLGWYGLMVVVDGRPVMVLGDEADRAALEVIAATVELADGAVVADSPELPDGWRSQGRVADLFGVSNIGLYGGGGGETIGYFAVDPSADAGIVGSVTVSTVPGGVPDVAASAIVPLPDKERSDITVRGRPAVLVHVPEWPAVTSPTDGIWFVSWVERPGEVIRVSGSGVSREDLLAVAEGVRPAEPGEWDRLARESLRNPPRAQPDEVVLGEGTFGDGSPWVLVVHPDGGSGDSETGESIGDASMDSIGAAIPSDVELAGPEPRLELRTTTDASSGISSSMGSGIGGPEQPEAFLDGITAEGGGARGWSYGLVAAEVAAVDLVAAGGEVLASAEVLAAGEYRAFLVELPPGLLPWADGEPSGEPEGVTESSSGASGATATTVLDVQAAGGSHPGPYLVARSADGTEIGRQPLP